MWFEWGTETLFYGNEALTIAFVCALAILLVAATLAFFLRAPSVFLAFAALTVGGGVLLVTFLGLPWSETPVFFSLLAVFIGGVYLFLFVALKIRARIAKRKKERAKAERKLQFALPDRDNSFVRARLNTVLQVDERPAFSSPVLQEGVCFSHARTLLARVKEAPLSPAERLETDELSKMIALYLQKSDFTAEDARVVNEAFARILKLSAKYAV